MFSVETEHIDFHRQCHFSLVIGTTTLSKSLRPLSFSLRKGLWYPCQSSSTTFDKSSFVIRRAMELELDQAIFNWLFSANRICARIAYQTSSFHIACRHLSIYGITCTGRSLMIFYSVSLFRESNVSILIKFNSKAKRMVKSIKFVLIINLVPRYASGEKYSSLEPESVFLNHSS